MKVYYPIQEYNSETEGFYNEYIVPNNFPKVADLIYTAPDENLKYPRWNYTHGCWESDYDKLIEELRTTINAQSAQITDLQTAMVADFESEVTSDGEDLSSIN